MKIHTMFDKFWGEKRQQKNTNAVATYFCAIAKHVSAVVYLAGSKNCCIRDFWKFCERVGVCLAIVLTTAVTGRQHRLKRTLFPHPPKLRTTIQLAA